MFKSGQIVTRSFIESGSVTVIITSAYEDSFNGIVISSTNTDYPQGSVYEGYNENWELLEGEITLNQKPVFPFAVGDIVKNKDNSGNFVVRVTEIDTRPGSPDQHFAGMILHYLGTIDDYELKVSGEIRPEFIASTFKKVKVHFTDI